MAQLRRIAILGSGNWGSTIAKIVGNNVLSLPNYEPQVRMLVYEEDVDGRKLTDIINTDHENVKYLPGVKLPSNVVAIPDASTVVKDADILIFVLPHQFLRGTCSKLKGKLKPKAYGVSLIKGLDESPGSGVRLLTDNIRDALDIPCCVLMGANLASEVSAEMFCEATIGSEQKERGNELKQLFQTSYFRITVITDEVGTELCGALKNIVAVGAGLADAMGYGDNTKAAIIRLGYMEMRKFIYAFFGERNPQENTFLESCGVADLITTCYGGRNKKMGMALATTTKSLPELERELLGGQSAQGPLTAAEVYSVLNAKKLTEQYPIFTTIHHICTRELKPQEFVNCLYNHPEHR